MNQDILQAYGFPSDAEVTSFGSGLINRTWKVTTPDGLYILQRVNDLVFKNPEAIAGNIQLIAHYLQTNYPDYFFVAPVPAINGKQMIHLEEEGYFRVFPFVTGSQVYTVVETPEQAFEAATQFGRFTRLLSDFPADKLQVTIPGFHDLSLRFRHFENALASGNKQRIAASRSLIDSLLRHRNIVAQYEALIQDPAFKSRVTHHDTKISNVLFDAAGKSICVIDMDTVMPGFFISDVGDMMRTYLSPVSEEEKDTGLVQVRDEMYQAIVAGYRQEMQGELSSREESHFFYAGSFMIYMQALRFLADHLEDDCYYGARYEGHNYVRAQNQLVLLERLLEKEACLTAGS